MGTMWTRLLALTATIWAGAYLVGYLVLVSQDGGSPAWWYAGLIVIGLAPLVAVLAGRLSRPALAASAILLGLAALLGLLSIGIFLLPAIACVIAAALVLKPASDPAPGHR
ncbi:hypothetical protein [Rhizomonospora bruguierae]|uniref:hypothetical protein n=1 Tax=Rhizomonospora bruguierae TaxID=1581705 RepID=UPI001BCC2645|nr:hypothetical protein [Micromonospora sp. NBRC 107566]